ncbi:MAG: energy-coupled thiamine transporter ThiT [Ethanoligenens sp.]|uniref:energy-coupled thiamine transporter ThiT n=1 Tax=Ethanoligenens sp. TaxID=2099655 RepID=UPI0039EBD400
MKNQKQAFNRGTRTRMNARTLRLVESGILIALAVVLSLLKLWQMPLGGEITFCSMLPILIAGYKYGPKWGLLTGFTFSIIKLLLDGGLLSSFAGMHWQSIVGSAFLDYIIAFSALGLAGIYGRGFVKFLLGIVTAVAIRFVSHVISGVVIFYAYAFDVGSFPKSLAFLKGHVLAYSVLYNAFYLLPDLAICLVVGILLYRPCRSLIEPQARFSQPKFH